MTESIMIAYFAALCQGLLGASDTFYFHEWRLRLPLQNFAAKEQILHGIRNGLYALLCLQIALIDVYGIFSWVVLGILAAEIVVTMLDFVQEDRTRKLPAGERVMHGMIAILFGVFLAYYVPFLFDTSAEESTITVRTHSLTWIFTIMGVGALGWTFRDLLAAQKIRLGAST